MGLGDLLIIISHERLEDHWLAYGGTLLIAQHHPSDVEVVPRPDLPDLFATSEQLAADLDREGWDVTAEDRPRTAVHDGHEVTIRDAVLIARRRP